MTIPCLSSLRNGLLFGMQVYARMQEQSLEPTATTYTALVSAHCKSDDLDAALEVYCVTSNDPKSAALFGSSPMCCCWIAKLETARGSSDCIVAGYGASCYDGTIPRGQNALQASCLLLLNAAALQTDSTPASCTAYTPCYSVSNTPIAGHVKSWIQS